MREITLSLRGLSPVFSKPIDARFDGGSLSSDTGVLALREVKRRLGIADRLAGCLRDDCMAERVRHSLADIILAARNLDRWSIFLSPLYV